MSSPTASIRARGELAVTDPDALRRVGRLHNGSTCTWQAGGGESGWACFGERCPTASIRTRSELAATDPDEPHFGELGQLPNGSTRTW